jgi:putative aldouronate transport system substrate-binding protein
MSEAVRNLVRQFTAGDLSRRDFMARAAVLGLSSSAIGSILAEGVTPVVAQDDPLASWPPPAYIPIPETEIMQPITAPLTEETVSFRLLNNDFGDVTDFVDNRFTEWLEEKTNVHIEWELVPWEESGSTLNLMLSSGGDLPEIIFNMVGLSQAQLYGAQGIFLPLNDLIAEQAPRLQRLFEIYPEARDIVTEPDGNIYVMPAFGDCYQCSMSKRLWIYQPWLDALGLDMPQTTDEFEQVLLAFKEQDPNGNGQADEIPLSGTMSEDAWYGAIDHFFMNSFLFNPGNPWLVLQEGKVTPAYTAPEWKEGLTYLHRLYEQGLIDPQFFSQEVDGLQRLGNNPDVVILGAAPSGWWYDFVSIGEGETRWTEYVSVPPLEGPQGVRYAPWEPTRVEPSVVITRACKDPALAVRWVDTLYWQEATLRNEAGVLGEDWRWAEEGELDVAGRQALWKTLTAFEGPTNRSWAGLNPMHYSAYIDTSAVVDPTTVDSNLGFRLYDAAKSNYEPYKQPAELVLPPLSFTDEQTAAIADAETTISQYVNQMITAFVRGDSDIDAGWEQYLATLEQMGLANYLQVYQEAYDAKYGN